MLQSRERIDEQSRAIHATVANAALLFGRPASKHVFAGKMNDGVHPFETAAIDRPPFGIPGDCALTWRGAASYQRNDLDAASAQRRGQWGADQAGRYADGDFHSDRIASASISTSMSGSTRRATATSVQAGRMSPNTSPCAWPTACQCAISVTY